MTREKQDVWSPNHVLLTKTGHQFCNRLYHPILVLGHQRLILVTGKGLLKNVFVVVVFVDEINTTLKLDP